MKNYKNAVFLFILTPILCLSLNSCVSDDIEDILGGIGDDFISEIEATVQFDNGEELDFEGFIVPLVIWEEEDDVMTLKIGGVDEDFSYNSYGQAVLSMDVYDVDGAGNYPVSPDSDHVSDHYNSGVSFAIMSADQENNYYPLYFEMGSGVLNVEKLNSERSKGSFEFELFLTEGPEEG